MKTLYLALGLLLLTVYCLGAVPNALRFSSSPGSCCFKFSGKRLPGNIVSIEKTHSSCVSRKRGFIVQTGRGRKICYSQTNPLALDAYTRFRRNEVSGPHH